MPGTQPSGTPLVPNGRLVRWFRWSLPRLYLQRFPLLLGFLLVGYVPFALGAVPAMFRSTLVLTAGGLVAVSTFALVAAIVVLSTSRTVLLCGAARFGIPWPARIRRLPRANVIAHLALAAPIVATAVYLSVSENAVHPLMAVASVLAGAGGAALFTGFALAVNAWLAAATQPLPDLVVPDTEMLFPRLRLLPTPRAAAAVAGFLRRVRPFLGPGYFGSDGELQPAHSFAAGIFAAFGVFYLGAYFLGKPVHAAGVPALVFILILATFVTLLISAIAFFLDRYHLPTLFPIVVWVSALSWVSASDHYFALTPLSGPLLAATPYEIAGVRQRPLLTVIAVDGGGIQAAAWGATVLTGIEERWQGFHRSVGIISAVSGGSVGTMLFVSALRADRPPDGRELSHVREASRRGSLSEVAWGLAYPDLWRALVPIWFGRFEKDRGWAMEQAWRRNFHPHQVPTLGDWMAGVRDGWLPAVALNATTVESGQRFSFATFRPPEEGDVRPGSRPWGLGTVVSTYPNRDIDVPTAARLSATFPYVTPIATAMPDDDIQAWHYADGGYYDNTGMGIAMRWLDTAMLGHESEFQDAAVAFVRIRSSPAGRPPQPKERAWAYGAIGPIAAALSVRTVSQRERSETELEVLQRLWCQRHVNIQAFEFAFELPDARRASTGASQTPGMKDPPLSWQLTRQEVSDLESAWASEKNQHALNQYLALKSHPTAGACVGAQLQIGNR